MAIYRNIQTSFWEDTKVTDIMTPEDKYFYLYLLTNPHTNQCGCYEISKRQMANETGYNIDTIENLLSRFENFLSLIRYSNESKEILIKNWHKYNWTSSPKVKKCIENELKSIKTEDFKKYFDTLCIQYIYPMHTHPQEEQEKEQEQKEEKNNNKNKINEMEEKFNIFWNKYPRKVSKDKAKKAFFKINFSDVVFSEILNSLDNFIKSKSWQKENGQYIPYPATWINQKRWEDEFEDNSSFLKVTNVDPNLENRYKQLGGDSNG